MAVPQFRTSINEYLEGLPEPVLMRLYSSPATCLAIFRLFPPMVQLFIMAMLYSDKGVHPSDLSAWVRAGSRRKELEAFEKLRSMHLIKETGTTISLQKTFRTSMRAALTGGDTTNSFGVPCDTEDKHRVDVAFLDEHANRQWELILHFMVGTETERVPNDGVVSLLQHSGLMEGTSARNMRITNAGFQFLLLDVNGQIWTLLLQYLNMAEDLQMDPVEVLHFLFMLGSLELGQDYSLVALSDTQKMMLDDLRDYGIVYQRKASSRRFYPTRLATTLTTDAGAQKSAASTMTDAIGDAPAAVGGFGSGFVILETNFKMYAYTDSPLQIAVLNLFAHLKSRFRNMVSGQITRESVRRALLNGITADQIIAYLNVHAHEQMRRRGPPVLPPTVVDQIRLWQLEMERMKTVEGYLFSDFKNNYEYDTTVTYAKELGVVVWENKNKGTFFVTKEGNQQIVDFVRRKVHAG
ncbi:transcription factor Tfb2-domain-containing protein [Dipodascopsis tothii]|uniref:transcription factor Tfb2-domain-containing protein n=1 Tax=Dipodascopsis tothii TaxID=44089 RepID=UPI0034CDDC61